MADPLVREKTIAFSIAQEILTTNADIPPIPANGAKILAMVRQPKSKIDIPSFVKLVESDPGLLTRILQLANSPFYSEIEKIVSLRAAITRIGLIEIVNSVCLYFFQKMLPRFPKIEGFTYNDFWSHSWACAVANRRLGHPNLGMGILPGELYMTGLLHGIGKLLLAIHFTNDFSKCIQKATEQGLSLQQVEKEVFGTTDALVASKVLNSWNLPANVCEGVAYYQLPEQAPPEYIIISGLTQFAYAVAELSGVGRSGDGVKTLISSTYFGQQSNLRISKPDVQEKLIKEILDSMKEKAETVVHVPKAPKRAARAMTGATIKSRDAKTKTRSAKKRVVGWIKSLWGKK